MADEAGDLDLMHREDHPGRAQARAEDRADVRDVGGARAFAAELGGDQHAEQFLLTDRLERLGGKASVAVDRVGMALGDLRRGFGATMKSRAPAASPDLARALRVGSLATLALICVASVR